MDRGSGVLTPAPSRHALRGEVAQGDGGEDVRAGPKGLRAWRGPEPGGGAGGTQAVQARVIDRSLSDKTGRAVNVYLDSSVLLRVIMGLPNRLKEWKTIREAVASALVEVECLRTLDRLRLREQLEHDDFARRREAVFRFLEEVEIVEPTRTVLTRAALPTVPLGTLDAIHLATALLW